MQRRRLTEEALSICKRLLETRRDIGAISGVLGPSFTRQLTSLPLHAPKTTMLNRSGMPFTTVSRPSVLSCSRAVPPPSPLASFLLHHDHHHHQQHRYSWTRNDARHHRHNHSWSQSSPHVSSRSSSTSYDQSNGDASDDPSPGPPSPPTPPNAKQARELNAVNVAVGVNIAIFFAKVGTWCFTRSGALLAEALHSFADVVNQLLLRAGVQQSRRPATLQHPYGFHREKYIYALMSAVGVFCIGAGASVVHGIQALLDPPALEHMGYSLAVLGVSSLAEMYSLRVALTALQTGAREQGQPIWRYLMSSNDPTTAAVLAEDAGAVAGLGIAGIASYMTFVTGNPAYDAVGSIAVGCLMGAIAVTLIRNNKRFLIGQAMRPDMHAAIVCHLKRDPMILAVKSAKSEEIGDGVYRFAAEISWSGEHIVEKYLEALPRDSIYAQIRETACQLPSNDLDDDALRNAMDLTMMNFGRGVIRTVGEEIDRLEVELKELCPGLAYVDLETDRGRVEMSSLECPITMPSVGSALPQQQQQQEEQPPPAAAAAAGAA